MTIPTYDNATLYPRRKHPHHGTIGSNVSPPLIFLTVCTRDRSPILANPRAHGVLRDLWCDNSRWIVGQYVLMPEHCHLIACEAGHNKTPLGRWIGWWKQQSSIRFETGSLVWQRDFWDVAIRNEEMLANKIAYIRNNPMRRGPVGSVEEWPFRGELHRLNWTGGAGYDRP